MNDNSKLTRKERERLQRRQEILSSATKLFAEKGYTNTTLEDIAIRSEFGIGTIYNYFANKEEIFRCIVDISIDDHVDIVLRVNQEAQSAVDFLSRLTREFYRYCLNNKDEFLMFVQFAVNNMNTIYENKAGGKYDRREAEIRSIFHSRVTEGIKNREIRDINAGHLQDVYYNLVFPYITFLIKTGQLNEGSMDELVSFILDLLFNGIKPG